MLKIISVYFYYFKVTIRIFKITYMTFMFFCWSTALEECESLLNGFKQ